MAKKGIDVSYANGNIDWSKVKDSGVEFAILRSTFGSELPSQIDSQFFQNAQGCVQNNIPFGIYHFAYFVNEQKAMEEADFAIKKANEYKQYVKFIVLDVEEDSERYANSMGYNPDWTACSIAFLERVRESGYIPVLYSNYSWLKYKFNFDKLKNYKLWYAAPDASQPAYTCAVWQYSWKGKVNGISGDVDMNYLYDNSLFAATATTTKTSTNSSTTSKTTTVDDKTKFLNTARSYIGKDGSYVCKTKLGYSVIYDWCAFAVSAIMKDCDFIGKYIAKIEGGAGSIPRESDTKYGTFFIKGIKTPQAGDFILFRYGGNYTDKYHSDHIGIVENISGNIITTLEGNVDGNNSNWAATSTFKRKTRDLTDNTVYAFYRPNWTAANSSTTTTSEKKTSHAVSQIASATNVDFSVKVTSNNGVNIRAGASTSYDVLSAVPYGVVLTVAKQTSGGGYTWGLITYNGVTGWIALNYTEKIENVVTLEKGDKVKVKNGAVVYGTNQTLNSFVYKTIYQIIEISGNRVVIGMNGQVTTAIDKKYLTKV